MIRTSPQNTITLLALILVAGLPASRSSAQLLAVDVSNDLAWNATGGLVDDEGARRVILPSTLATLSLGTLPATADLTAYESLYDGRRAFALDTFVDLGGGVKAGPEDLVAWNGTTFSLYFDGSAAGIPPGVAIDAVSFQHTAGLNYILLSFDVPVSFTGVGLVDDEDIASWNGMAWSVLVDGSGIGIPESLDVDGFDRDDVDGTRFFSFDTSGHIGGAPGVDFDDEDVVAFNGMVWSLAYDASAGLGSSFAAGDLDALGARTVNIFRDGFENNNVLEWTSASL